MATKRAFVLYLLASLMVISLFASLDAFAVRVTSGEDDQQVVREPEPEPVRHLPARCQRQLMPLLLLPVHPVNSVILFNFSLAFPSLRQAQGKLGSGHALASHPWSDNFIEFRTQVRNHFLRLGA